MERLSLSWDDQRRFVSTVSHELRTPLTIVQGYLRRTIKRSKGLTADERQGLQTAEEESIRMRMLLDDLLDLSRGDSGQLQLNHHFLLFQFGTVFLSNPECSENKQNLGLK